jgi:hypothetical protein
MASQNKKIIFIKTPHLQQLNKPPVKTLKTFLNQWNFFELDFV